MVYVETVTTVYCNRLTKEQFTRKEKKKEKRKEKKERRNNGLHGLL